MAVAKLPSSGSGQNSPALPRTPSPTSTVPPVSTSTASDGAPAEVSKAEAIAALNTLELFLSKTVLEDRSNDLKSSPSSCTKSTAEGEFNASHRDLIRELQGRLLGKA